MRRQPSAERASPSPQRNRPPLEMRGGRPSGDRLKGRKAAFPLHEQMEDPLDASDRVWFGSESPNVGTGPDPSRGPTQRVHKKIGSNGRFRA